MSWMEFIEGDKQQKHAQMQPMGKPAVPPPPAPAMRSSPTQVPFNQSPRSSNPPTPTRPKNNLEKTFFMEWLKKNKPAIFQMVSADPGVMDAGVNAPLQNAFKEFSAESKNMSTNPAMGIPAPGFRPDAQFESEKFLNLLKTRNPAVWSRVVDDPESLKRKLQEFKAGKPIEQLAATDEEIKIAGANWFDQFKKKDDSEDDKEDGDKKEDKEKSKPFNKKKDKKDKK